MVLLLRNPESSKRFFACDGRDAQILLDLLQDVSGFNNHTNVDFNCNNQLLDLDYFSVVKPLILKTLLRLSRDSRLHPRCFALSGLQKIGKQVAAGGFGDVWKGLVCGQNVSVKIMRIFEDSDVEDILKQFGREAVIWRQLCHPNVLPFFGLYRLELETRLCLVSPWMENGTITKFLAKNNPSNTERFSLILDVALGLQYLHENKIVHGDLKGVNILVTPSRRACIADFGVSSIATAMTLQFTSITHAQGGTPRYQAPELLLNESQNHLGSDVYAFGCVGYEILTRTVPFHEVQKDMAVILQVVGGKTPSRPMSCSGTTALDSLWNLFQRCWETKAEMRPTAPQIVERLVGPSIGATTTSSTTDWDDKFTSKFRRSLQAEPLLPSMTQIERMLFGDGQSSLCKPVYIF
ncbi:kinase-like domain-containing protein [Mycena capillaripes]|nr:kinase-like domain-containing protein [Mycena capillaripes]